MTKIVINACYGGFSLSRAAVLRAREISGDPKWGGACIAGDFEEDGDDALDADYGFAEVARTDAALVQVVEEMGKAACGMCSNLRIREVPAGTQYRISEYDGFESIETRDSVDWLTA